MNYLNNHFHKKDAYGEVVAERGTFAIAGNAITPVTGMYLPGQYIRIIGSAINDGVYQVESANEETIFAKGELANESFDGTIVTLAVPREFVELVREIEQFQAEAVKNPNAGVVSVGIGSFSYSNATGANGMPASWIDVFDTRLRRYRKMFPEVV